MYWYVDEKGKHDLKAKSMQSARKRAITVSRPYAPVKIMFTDHHTHRTLPCGTVSNTQKGYIWVSASGKRHRLNLNGSFKERL